MVRRATKEDIKRIKEIYRIAKQYMIATGNPTQWPSYYPGDEEINNDLANGNLYVGEIEKEIHFCFSLIVGVEETYVHIENGEWLNDKTYGTIHRVASDGKEKHVFKQIMEYSLSIIDNIRIDTHKDNQTMRYILREYGFKECGIIYVLKDSPRIAFHYCK